MVLEPDALNKFHDSVIRTSLKISQHAPDEPLPRCWRDIQSHLFHKELVVKVSLN